MSYHVHIYSVGTKLNDQYNDKNFFENPENFVVFTQSQQIALKDRLILYGYEFNYEDEFGLHFNHDDEDFGTVLLTNTCLYFNASSNPQSIFEVGMTASEFTDTGDYAKYDPQIGAWETFE